MQSDDLSAMLDEETAKETTANAAKERPKRSSPAPRTEAPPPKTLTKEDAAKRLATLGNLGANIAKAKQAETKAQTDAAAACDKIEESAELAKPCTSVDVSAWLDEPDEPDNPLIFGLVEIGSYVALVGPAKAAKTWLEIETAVCVAAGVDWFGHKVKRQRVYVANVEVSAKQYKKRVRSIIKRLNIDPHSLNGGWFHLDNLRGKKVTFDDCYWEARRRGAEVTILDPFYQLFEGKETDEGDCLNAIEKMKRFLAVGMTLFIVFHSPKGFAADRQIVDMISGSSVLARFPENVIAILPHATDKNARVIDCSVLRDYPAPDPFSVKFDEGALVLAPEITPELKSGSRYQRKTKAEREAEGVKHYNEVLASMTATALAFVKKRDANLPNTKQFKNELLKQYGKSAVESFVSSIKSESIEGLVSVNEDMRQRKAEKKKGPSQAFITTPERAKDYQRRCELLPLE